MRSTVPTPLAALARIEKLLQGSDAYHLAMNRQASIGLGQWIKLVIKEGKKQEREREALITNLRTRRESSIL